MITTETNDSKTELDKGLFRKICFTPQGNTVPPVLEMNGCTSLGEIAIQQNEGSRSKLAKEAEKQFLALRGIECNPISGREHITDIDKWVDYIEKKFPDSDPTDFTPKHFPSWDRTQYYVWDDSHSKYEAEKRAEFLKAKRKNKNGTGQ